MTLSVNYAIKNKMKGVFTMSSTQKNIEQVVDLILEDYAGGRDIDKLETDRQPDKDVIIDVIEKLRRIMFPGYFRDKTYRIYNAKHNLSMLIEDVMFNLSRQITRALQAMGQEKQQAENILLKQ